MFAAERIVEFGMCDSGGILFFPRIFELAHSAYEEFILKSDLQNNYFENEEIAIPLISAASDFHKPISLHEVLKINIVVSKIGNSSFQLTTAFLDEKDSTKATVITTHIFVDKKEFNKMNIPDEFLSLLKKNQS